MNVSTMLERYRKDSIPPNYFNKKRQSIIKTDKVNLAKSQEWLQGMMRDMKIKRQRHLKKIRKMQHRGESGQFQSKGWLPIQKQIRRKSCEGEQFGLMAQKQRKINEYVPQTFVAQIRHRIEMEKLEKRRKMLKNKTMIKLSSGVKSKKLTPNNKYNKQTSIEKSVQHKHSHHNESHYHHHHHNHDHHHHKQDSHHHHHFEPQKQEPLHSRRVERRESLKPMNVNNLKHAQTLISSFKTPSKDESKDIASSRSCQLPENIKLSTNNLAVKSLFSQENGLTATLITNSKSEGLSIKHLKWKINLLIWTNSNNNVKILQGSVDDFNIVYQGSDQECHIIENRVPEIGQSSSKLSNLIKSSKGVNGKVTYEEVDSRAESSSSHLSSIYRQQREKYKIIIKDSKTLLQVMMSQSKLRQNKTINKFICQSPTSVIRNTSITNWQARGHTSSDKRAFVISHRSHIVTGQSHMNSHYLQQRTYSRQNPYDDSYANRISLQQKKTSDDILQSACRVKTSPSGLLQRVLSKKNC